MSEELYQFFSSVLRENVNNIPDFEGVHNGNCVCISDLMINIDMVRTEISKLTPSTSSGPGGGYSNRILKDYMHELSFPLSIVFNELLWS